MSFLFSFHLFYIHQTDVLIDLSVGVSRKINCKNQRHSSKFLILHVSPSVCIVGDVVYSLDEPVPAEQPCLRCRCQPPGVQCETTRCIKRPGCRTIHKPNQCCPDYQCGKQHHHNTRQSLLLNELRNNFTSHTEKCNSHFNRTIMAGAYAKRNANQSHAKSNNMS